MSDKVVLAYRGGLDTSVAIKWIKEKYNLDVIAVTIDVGNERDFSTVRQKALDAGAIKALVIDTKETFVNHFVFPALQADAIYEGQYPMATDLADYLVKKGEAFRTAHEIVGKLVSYAVKKGKSFNELSLSEYQDFSPLFEDDVYSITVESSLAARDNTGGTAPKQVEKALSNAKKLIGDSIGKK